MIAVDTNILVYAHREGSQHHPDALSELRALAEGVHAWALPVFCIGEFIRVVTHPRIFDPPSTVDQALGALGGLLASPSVRVLYPGPEYPKLYADCVREADARGNLAFDAQIAAVCEEYSVSELLTMDRDFDRFSNIRVRSLNDAPR